jgi:tripartite-type tricarboxylate transporter receptor subunit TctC
MRRLFLILTAAQSLIFVGNALAQGYPARPVTIVVPYAVGGPTDTFARIFAEQIKGSLGQSVIVDNRGGGSGVIGVERVVRAAPNGYTIGIGNWSTHVVVPAMQNVPYDVLRDLKPIALIAQGPQIIVTKNAVPAKTLRELITWIRASPTVVMQGTAGPAAASHLAGIMFQNLSGTHLRAVPYRGGGPAMQALLAGEIDMLITPAGNALPHIRSGRIRAYAVTSPSRLEAAPEIPTVDEAGLPGFHTSLWHAFWAPPQTPDAILAKLNAALVDAISDPIVRKRLEYDLGQQIPAREQQTPQALSIFHTTEIAKWWPIIRGAGIKAR